MMDEGENEFLPCSIVKSFHCHRRAYEVLTNEGASVRNALPLLPATLLISPGAAAKVLIKVKFKNSLGNERRAAEMIKQGRCCASEGFVSVNTRARASGLPASRAREGASLWETFVTGVTAQLDGWAASIWLQCM